MKALFITHEGFGSSIFRSQVIEHCDSLRVDGIDFDILSYETFQKSWKTSVDNLREYQKWGGLLIILKKAMNIYWPISSLINLILLVIDILRLSRLNDYKFIHARADYTAFLCIISKPIHRLPVVWDCRGDSVDELDFSIEKFSAVSRVVLFTLLSSRQRIIRFINSKLADSCICVSEALRRVISSINQLLPITVIPCPVPTKKFYYSDELRNKYRNRLGLKSNDLLFIYSGSMTGYQSIDDFLWYYEKIMSLNNSHVIIATVDKLKAMSIFESISSYKLTITSIPYDEMNEIYCAADFALMTRVPRPLNYVASPTKFGEYCLSGLVVIHNDSVCQVSEFTKNLGNGLSLSIWPPISPSLDSRRKIADSARMVYGREFLNYHYLNLYDKLN